MTEREAEDIETGTRRAPPVLTIDYGLYERYLADTGLTDDQKREFLDALWSVIVEFVTLGFEVHPAQVAQKSCGQLFGMGDQAAAAPRDALESGNIPDIDFRQAACGVAPQAAERIQK